MLDLPNDRTDTYLHAIKESVNDKVQLVVAIFPTSRDDRYAAFKKLCCIETPVPSQVNSDLCRYMLEGVVVCCRSLMPGPYLSNRSYAVLLRRSLCRSTASWVVNSGLWRFPW